MQKFIKSKTLKVLLSFVVLVSLTIHLQVKSTSALGLDTAVKIVAGSTAEHLVKSMGEKMGVKWSERTLKNTVDHINTQSSKGNVIYADFGKKVNETAQKGTVKADDPLWKDYVVDPFLWLTGADLIITAFDAFRDSVDSGTPIENYKQGSTSTEDLTVLPKTVTTDYIKPTVSAYMCADCGVLFTGGNGLEYVAGMHQSSTTAWKVANGNPTFDRIVIGAVANYNGTLYFPMTYYYLDPFGVSRSFQLGVKDTPSNRSKLSVSVADSYESRVYSNDDVIDMTYVDGTWRKIDVDDDDDSEKNVTHPIVVNVPVTINNEDDDDTNNSTSVWNNKIDDDELQVILKPIIYNNNYDSDTHYYNDELKKIGDPIDVPESFFKEVYKMAQQIDDLYDGLVEFLTKAVLGMKTMVDGTSGLTSFLDTFFDWLPSDMKVLLSSSFMLGVVAFFLRR